MHSKVVSILIGIGLIVIVGGTVLFQSRVGDAREPGGNGDPRQMVHTMEEVAAHGSSESCWTVIDGHVYDLTEWIKMHPGGSRAILGLCGKDGTTAFRGQHGQAQQQADILITYRIGALTD
jgi:cytochrome b involved in lipid metabolism